MDSNNRLFLSIFLLASSLLLTQSNGLKEILTVMVIIVPTFNVFYKWSIKRATFNPKLPSIYSFSFIVSFLFIIWINIVSIQIGSTTSPFLPGDGLPYFEIARNLATTNIALTEVSLNYIGYPLILSWVFTIFGSHLIFGLLTNMILLFFNIFLISECILKITRNPKDYQNGFILILLTSGFLATGFMLLKDIFIVTAITLSLYASLNLLEKQSIKKNYIFLIIAVLIMALFRITFVWVPVALFVLITFKRRNIAKSLPIIIGLLILGISIGSRFALKEVTVDSSIDSALSNQVISSRLEGDTSGFVAALISGYDNWGLIKKTLFLPITTGIQFITPFNVYDFGPALDFPYYFISRNYNILWLLFIGPLLLFSIFDIVKFRKNRDPLLVKITFLGIIFYMVPAFIYGGAIPRYAVPFYPLLLPVISMNLSRIQTLRKYKLKWFKFFTFYILLFLFLLVLYLFFKGL